MAVKTVNLDALIPREDLDITIPGAIAQKGQSGFSISELEQGKITYGLLRKPDFQRETNDWDVDNVVTLIKSFRDSDLIPSVIMWRAESGYAFVIDGAHRLSALIAWVHDDYGDRDISRKFFNHKIPKQQQEAADECRARVAIEVGTYAERSGTFMRRNPAPNPQEIKWASNISRTIETQWVNGDATSAEHSFLVINQRSVQIDDTEIYMVQARRKPNVIAARALIRCGTGHEYWSKFPDATREEIKNSAKKIYDMLFEPDTSEILGGIDMPVAGKPYSADAVRISLDLINYANDLRTQSSIDELPEDFDGAQTAKFLDKTNAVVKYIAGNNAASLGLHPSVYFWSSTGKHQPSAFLAVIIFYQYLIKTDNLIRFSFQRAKFEEFLVTRQSIIKHILGKFGGWKKSAPSVFEMYKIIFEEFSNGKTDKEVEEAIVKDNRFYGLSDAIQLESSPNKRIAKETKAAIRRKSILLSSLRCAICFSRMPHNSVSHDHIVRVEDGGRGTENNVQLSHQFCNHGLKEHCNAKSLPLPLKPDFLGT